MTQQLVVAPVSDDLPSARYNTSSARAIVDGREATATTVASRNVSRRLASTFASVRGIERRRGVVEQQRRRTADQRPGEGDALPLTAAETDAALADDRVEAIGEVVDERSLGSEQRRRGSRSSLDIAAHGDVVAHRAGEQERLLEDQHAALLGHGDRAVVDGDQTGDQV